MNDYIQKLKSDLLEQFRGMTNIEALLEVVGEQLNDVSQFFEQIELETDVRFAKGKQLDGIGDIVSLTRADVAQYLQEQNSDVLAADVFEEDDIYRQYLMYKILKNTSACTYDEIVKALKVFWDGPLKYSEDPDLPATMIFDTGEIDGFKDTRSLFRTPLIRPAGITLKVTAQTSTAMGRTPVTVLSGLGYAITENHLPDLSLDGEENS